MTKHPIGLPNPHEEEIPECPNCGQCQMIRGGGKFKWWYECPECHFNEGNSELDDLDEEHFWGDD